ncbi:hypothetical protein OH77DRAFT_310857 [Trametes cingulata]|nr:hypothetical protein OH77DRAFT_310857 [Trametes cingulata]
MGAGREARAGGGQGKRTFVDALQRLHPMRSWFRQVVQPDQLPSDHGASLPRSSLGLSALSTFIVRIAARPTPLRIAQISVQAGTVAGLRRQKKRIYAPDRATPLEARSLAHCPLCDRCGAYSGASKLVRTCAHKSKLSRRRNTRELADAAGALPKSVGRAARTRSWLVVNLSATLSGAKCIDRGGVVR